MEVTKNPNCLDKSTKWISLSTTTNVLLLIIVAAIVLVVVVGTNNIIGVNSSPTGFGITAAYAQASKTVTTATTSSISSVLIETVTTVDSNGGSIVKVVQINPQEIKGVGLTTGIQYHSTTGRGVEEEEGITNRALAFSAGEGGGEDTTKTFVTNFNIIGSNTTTGSTSSASNSDIIIREDLDITVNSDGTITANIDNENSGCI
jgi:hypothetical protein